MEEDSVTNLYLLALEDLRDRLDEYEGLINSLPDLTDHEQKVTERVLTDVRRMLYDLEDDATRNGNK